jgi:hypothetical protein
MQAFVVRRNGRRLATIEKYVQFGARDVGPSGAMTTTPTACARRRSSPGQSSPVSHRIVHASGPVASGATAEREARNHRERGYAPFAGLVV